MPLNGGPLFGEAMQDWGELDDMAELIGINTPVQHDGGGAVASSIWPRQIQGHKEPSEDVQTAWTLGTQDSNTRTLFPKVPIPFPDYFGSNSLDSRSEHSDFGSS